MKKVIPYFLLLIPLFTSGCFTAMSKIGGGSGGGSPATVTLDIVTFPIQAVVLGPPLIAEAHREHAINLKAEKEANEDKLLMPILEKTPEIALDERWDLKSKQNRRVFINSFSNTNVFYTDGLLEEIHRTCPSVKDYVFRSRMCSSEFLTRHFEEEFEQAKSRKSLQGLANIVSNPNTPLELVEKASINQFPYEINSPASDALYQRGSKPWMNMLENDSAIALKERWDIKSEPRQFIFKSSFRNPKVRYTNVELERIYEICPSMRDYVFESQSCSSEFLKIHFDEAFEQGRNWPQRNGAQDRLHIIFRNPNCPIELVEKVAFATNYPGVAPSNAKTLLKQRQPEIQAH